MGNVHMEAAQINYRGGEKKMSVEEALKSTSGEAASIAQLQTDVANLRDVKANQITIAPTFSAETAYDPGDLVYYNGLSYRCVNAHEGEWDADDFAATTISNELASLMSGLTSVDNLNHISINFNATDVQDYLKKVIDTINNEYPVGTTINMYGAWLGACMFVMQASRASSNQTIVSAIPQPGSLAANKMWIAMKEDSAYTYSTIDMAVVN